MNNFIFADLSTFDIQAAQHFYHQCFDWTYQNLDEDYILCKVDGQPTAGLFTMPEKFQSMGMPTFWMSYIHVQDIHQVVREARKLGRVEIPPQPAPGGGLIALIRDPSGAGFTCYEGDSLGAKDRACDVGHRVWNELHVSDLAKVELFYTRIFGWQIKATNDTDRYEIYTPNEPEPIAGIQVTTNEIKGEKEYWGVYFSVHNLAAASARIEQSCGKIVAEQPLGSRSALLALDPQGAAFYVLEASMGDQRNRQAAPVWAPKWRAILGLSIVVVATLTQANWVWGVLFLLWVACDIWRGATHFMEYVERRKNPVVYWCIVFMWIFLSIYLLFE